MNKTLNKVTVLIAIYRSGNYIEAKIKNIMRQTIYDDCIFVLLNCQNLDNERHHYINLLSSRLIEIYYKDYIWLYRTWNDGIKSTESEYICNSNVDDMWHPEYLERCYNHMKNNDDISILSTNTLVTNIPNQHDFTSWRYISALPKGTYPHTTAGPCPMWKRSLHDKYGYFGNYRTIGDAKMWEKWHADGEQFSHLNESLSLYYINTDSLERRFDQTTGKSYRELDLNS